MPRLTETGIHWSDDADFWTLQFAASVIFDRATAAVLVGAATAAYERSDVNQPGFVTGELSALATAWRPNSAPRSSAGISEPVSAARGRRPSTSDAALTDYLAEPAGNPDTAGDPQRVG